MIIDELNELASSLGFDALGIAPVEPVGGGWFAPHRERFEAWLNRGDHGEMKWMADRAHERVVPAALLPDVRNAIILWMNHRTAQPPGPSYATGRVAAYAWGRDYHNVVRKAVRKFERALRARFAGFDRYISVDTGAVLERAFGERAAIGWIGHSTMLINQSYGTFGSIAAVFTNLDLPYSDDAHPQRCGTCRDCVTACPTDALSDTGLDARKCISYWTIEHRGLIPTHMRTAIGDWVFGCDICQDVCPWNRKAPRAPASIWQPKREHIHPDLMAWLNTPSETLANTLLGSPLRRARGEGLRRNALIVLANTGQTSALSVIKHLAATDPDPVIRATAVWAARQLGDTSVCVTARDDAHEMVRAEAD
ncbi:MAG: tRNA epoxyqueuosine(34) reductase QueG [Myxococcota bacterium]|nr:tRNA epoxyqueuosine(34) reductase QueG [Myxococcota bacterium]